MSARSPQQRIIYALDVPDFATAREQVDQLAGHVGVFKVGLELFITTGPPVVEMIHSAGSEVFLDLKLHDIPATMRGALRSVGALKPRFVTVHAEALTGMGNSVGEIIPHTAILGVTALTSLSAEDLSGMGYKETLCDPATLVRTRARKVFEAGCAGIICSGHEARRMRAEFGPRFHIITPGIRMADDTGTDDQSRVTTPAQAIRDGADYLVVGRPIRNASDPVAAADAIAQQIGTALERH